MASIQGDSFDEGRLDLVPMIDCIMLLLLFFMMTTKFSSEEKVISSLLPTGSGDVAGGAKKSTQLNQKVDITIYPAGLEKGQESATYQNLIKERQKTQPILQKAWIRIGGRPPLELDGSLLNQQAKKQMQERVDQLHLYLGEELKAFEIQGNTNRSKQPEVVIHCYSGLSWKFALIAYDAVRAYEASQPEAPKIDATWDPRDLALARAVYFAPPRVRNSSINELGDELQELLHIK